MNTDYPVQATELVGSFLKKIKLTLVQKKDQIEKRGRTLSIIGLNDCKNNLIAIVFPHIGTEIHCADILGFPVLYVVKQAFFISMHSVQFFFAVFLTILPH